MARSSNGIVARHGRACRTHEGGRCNCAPAYEAWIWSPVERKKIRKTFRGDRDAAVSWRREAAVQVQRGLLRTPTRQTLREAGEEWLEGAKAGSIRNRSGEPFKPSVLRGYRTALEKYLYADFGGLKLSAVTHAALQRKVEQLLGEGLSPSTVRNIVMPLRAIYRRAYQLGDVATNPTSGLSLPASNGRRDRIAPPEEAAQLLAALPQRDRALWATALYSGLRRGELRALEVCNVDLANGVIRVEAGWDDKEGRISLKSKRGRRTVPIPATLRVYLAEHRLRLPWSEGLFFGRAADASFEPSTVSDRAQRAWKNAELDPITLHECRHTYASLMIAAGVNAKALSTFMGHASITITMDRYGHLFPGSEEEAAALLDGYLARVSVSTL